jgi:hypothetical protein
METIILTGREIVEGIVLTFALIAAAGLLVWKEKRREKKDKDKYIF